jgi:prepilin-type N-terminal cleavage/methylation domain-containing protein
MRTTSGFTLLELLIVIGMIGVLSAIGFASVGGLRRSLALDEAGAKLSQQIQRARAQSMTTSSSWRVRIIDGDTFVLEQDTSMTTTPTWTNRNTSDLPGAMTFSNADNTSISFTTRGIGTLTTGNADFRIKVDGTEKLVVAPSMVGTIRTRKL